MSVPVMSDGIRSGVNWMRLNDRCRISRERADQQRLGQPRHADEQAVAAAEDGHQELLDDLVLADDDLADLVGHPLVGGGDFLDRLNFRRRHRVTFCEGTRSDRKCIVRRRWRIDRRVPGLRYRPGFVSACCSHPF